MSYDYEKMGALIRHIRKEKGLSQEVVSGLAGIGRTHLTMIETGGKNASVETLWRVALAMGMPLSELFMLYEKSMEEGEQK